MRLSKLILVLAVLATLLPACAQPDGAVPRADAEPAVDASVDSPADAYQPTASDCDRWHREAIHRCQILFHAGDCYERAAADYQTCLASVAPV